jgi:hypothetical protein
LRHSNNIPTKNATYLGRKAEVSDERQKGIYEKLAFGWKNLLLFTIRAKQLRQTRYIGALFKKEIIIFN